MIRGYLTKLNERATIDERGRLIVTPDLTKKLMIAIKEGIIRLVMDESDLMIAFGEGMPNSASYRDEYFTSLDDLVAAHISAIPPSNDVIKTKETTGEMHSVFFKDPTTGKTHEVPYLVGNDTIHFTLNCAVQNHDMGNDWDSFKYGVLVDFEKLDKEKVLDVKSEDTYLDGDVKLSQGYYLFCPLGEREKLAKENPNATIIEYDGIPLSTAISCMIALSGHKLEPYGTYSWGRNSEYSYDAPDVIKLEKLVSKAGYPVLKGRFGNALHSETRYMARRMWKREYEALISLVEYNIENGIDMPDDVLFPVMYSSGVYSVPGTVPSTIKDYKEFVFPILERHGYHVDDSLFDGIESSDRMKMIFYPLQSKGLPNIDIPPWENEVRNRVIGVLKRGKDKGTKGNHGVKK